MENATKALLIAAAILVAIVIISIGMVVLRQGTGTSEQAGAAMSEAEVTQFNSTFTNYCGNNVNGSQLNDLIRKVNASNKDEKDSEEGRYITVKVGASGSEQEVAKDGTYPTPTYPKSTSYRVKVTKEYNSGVVQEITATEK